MAVSLNWIDIVAIILYFFLVIGFGIWVIFYFCYLIVYYYKHKYFLAKSSFKNRGSVGGYFLAGRSMTFIPV